MPVRALKVDADAQVPWGIADPDLGPSSLDLEAV